MCKVLLAFAVVALVNLPASLPPVPSGLTAACIACPESSGPIIESFGLKGTFKGHPSDSPAMNNVYNSIRWLRVQPKRRLDAYN